MVADLVRGNHIHSLAFVSRGEIWAIGIVTFIGMVVFEGAVGSDPIT